MVIPESKKVFKQKHSQRTVPLDDDASGDDNDVDDSDSRVSFQSFSISFPTDVLDMRRKP